MVVFFFSALFLVPIFSFVFIVVLLKAIENIVRKRRYGAQLFWSSTFFALTMWSISVCAAIGLENS